MQRETERVQCLAQSGRLVHYLGQDHHAAVIELKDERQFELPDCFQKIVGPEPASASMMQSPKVPATSRARSSSSKIGDGGRVSSLRGTLGKASTAPFPATMQSNNCCSGRTVASPPESAGDEEDGDLGPSNRVDDERLDPSIAGNRAVVIQSKDA